MAVLWLVTLFSVFIYQDDSFKSKIAMFNNNSAKEPPADPFQTEDPFKSDPFTGLNILLHLLRFLNFYFPGLMLLFSAPPAVVVGNISLR